MMKKTCFLLILIALLISLSGCTGIENALHEAGEKIQSNQVETPQNNGGQPIHRSVSGCDGQGNRRGLQKHEG